MGGAPVSAVKDVIGHVDVRTTMGYVHATNEGKGRAVEGGSELWGEKTSTHLPKKLELTA
jgi:hypothetical protein